MKRSATILLLIALSSLLSVIVPQSKILAADTPVVRAVLFYSPSCGHCQKVITEDLPPLIEKYQDQLQIVGIDVTQENEQALYQSAIEALHITQDRLGVPTLIVGQMVLVGSDEIPNQFPGIIEQGLASGGIPWPDFPGLAEALSADASSNESDVKHASTNGLTISERFSLDPVANSIAVVILAGMLMSVIYIGLTFFRIPPSGPRLWPNWVVGILILVGLFAAGYLAYVEVTNTAAVCGPIGNCNLVQQSSYARLFGVLPVGVLGLVGYLAILVMGLIVQYGNPGYQQFAALLMWFFALVGTLFSMVLTFLEPFVIGTSCAWCLTSAVVMTLLLWAATPIAQTQLRKPAKADRRSRSTTSTVEG